MKAVYQSNGSGKLTVAQLEEELAKVPPQAEIQSLTVANSQRDGWVWSIRAEMPDLPPRIPQSFPHHIPCPSPRLRPT